MRTFLSISQRVLDLSPRYFRCLPKIGFSAVDFEGYLKIRKFFKISKIFKIQNFKDKRNNESYELFLGLWCLTDKDSDVESVFPP